MTTPPRDHGGGIDAAMERFGGERSHWLDLSTGINPVAYPVNKFSPHAWTALPDRTANDALTKAARSFWKVPSEAAILAAPGASALIARIPGLLSTDSVTIAGPTYNEHAAAFRANGWTVVDTASRAKVVVHPNNPTGQFHDASDLTAPFTIIDESFCDIAPDRSHIELASRSGTLVLKSFGKFWGLAGLRLGFAIGSPSLIERLTEMLGPWAVSGPALSIATEALSDITWAEETRARLVIDAERLDDLMKRNGATVVGGTSLFRLYDVDDPIALQTQLARHHIWSRVFPYSDRWIRLGLPAPDRWAQVEAAF